MENEKKLNRYMKQLSAIDRIINLIEEKFGGSDMVSVDIWQSDLKDRTWGFDVTATDTDNCLVWKGGYKTLEDLLSALNLVHIGARLANGKEV